MYLLVDLMNNDLKTNGECSFALAKEPMGIAKLRFYLTKNSRFTEQINKGFVTSS